MSEGVGGFGHGSFIKAFALILAAADIDLSLISFARTLVDFIVRYSIQRSCISVVYRRCKKTCFRERTGSFLLLNFSDFYMYK